MVVRPRDDSPGACGDGPDPRRARDGEPDSDAFAAADAIAARVRGAEPEEVPGRLCEVAVELLPVTGASVSLRSDGMPVQVSASSERAAHLAQIQATLGDGPCRSAVEEGAPVLACDLTSPRDAGRWPVFAQQATAAGVRAVYAVPLGSDAVCVGTLDLYRDSPGALTDRQLGVARLVAGAMTAELMSLPRGDEAESRGGQAWLCGLAVGHDEVHQAVGMIMAQLGVGADDALARLRGDAFARGCTVLEVAHDVITHHRRLERE
ncbi:GAF and ANTAR domain-containing protein [Streptomyces djakartensis]|uniref:GAF domain-containing protein n=1 Tax=Streptomyces djakartensis TaxID=68193 RepID=A0ABQ2ZN00_9ACTN|nr:GAF and ANTAR domain-containing protein [Streptomyces djakartensis]GGY19501.1 GAF domain-containing protein [Streptomyces djakartensis]